jgi:hypothetical protein
MLFDGDTPLPMLVVTGVSNFLKKGDRLILQDASSCSIQNGPTTIGDKKTRGWHFQGYFRR